MGAAVPASFKTANGCNNCGLPGHGFLECALQMEFPGKYGKGQDGTWRPGERAEFWAALPSDVKERVVQRARSLVAAKNTRKAAAAVASGTSATRVSPRTSVNRKVYLSFVARARLAAQESPNIAALADTGTPPQLHQPSTRCSSIGEG